MATLFIFCIIQLYIKKITKKEGLGMRYTKPAVINPNGVKDSVKGAVCGSGPCGRPCSKRA